MVKGCKASNMFTCDLNKRLTIKCLTFRKVSAIERIRETVMWFRVKDFRYLNIV